MVLTSAVTQTCRSRAAQAAAVFGGALLVRTAFCVIVGLNPAWQLGQHGRDFWTSTDGYVLIARSLVEERSFAFGAGQAPTVHRAPVYPVAIALAYTITGSFETAAIAVNILASSLTCVILFFIARHFLPPKACLLVATAAALYPHAIYFCASSWSDTMTAFAVTAYAASLLALVRRPRAGNVVTSGALLAVAALTKSVMLLWPVAVLGYAAWRARRLVVPLLGHTLVMLALVAPWSWRAYSLGHGFVPITTGGGFNLLTGNFMVEESWSSCDSAFKNGKRRTTAHATRALGLDEPVALDNEQGVLNIDARVDRDMLRLGLRQWIERPMLPLQKIFVNGLRFWYYCSSLGKSLMTAIVNFPMLVLALLGVAYSARRGAPGTGIFLFLLVAYVWAAHVMVIVHSRFYLIVMPLVILFAVLAVVRPAARSRPKFDADSDG